MPKLVILSTTRFPVGLAFQDTSQLIRFTWLIEQDQLRAWTTLSVLEHLKLKVRLLHSLHLAYLPCSFSKSPTGSLKFLTIDFGQIFALSVWAFALPLSVRWSGHDSLSRTFGWCLPLSPCAQTHLSRPLTLCPSTAIIVLIDRQPRMLKSLCTALQEMR